MVLFAYCIAYNHAIDEDFYVLIICICDENLKLSSDIHVSFASYIYNKNIRVASFS